MAGSVNKVILVGNLGRDPEVRSMQDGRSMVNMSVATSDTWRDRQSGERKERTEWHRVVVFNQQARNVATSLRKGDTVIVGGDLRFGTYTDKESGQTRETRDIVADNVGASLKYAPVAVERAPKASGPGARRAPSGPSAEPVSSTGVGIAR